MIKFIALLLLVFSINVHAIEQLGDSCDKHAGLSDSYVLALSSQPGFCQTYGYEAGKPECAHLPKNSYQAKHLTLHGLWPNQKACGQNYGYCGVEQKTNHCAYPPLDLSPQVAELLKKIMPSYYYGSCLERHEWNKHGSCQILSADQYFALAIRLAETADNSLFGQYLTQHQGQKVQLTYLREMIAQSFGPTNSTKIYLGCKKGILVDIYIQLPALISDNDSLESLIEEAPDSQINDTCPTTVILSNFNTESSYDVG
ncbi:ribonuclease T2 family protein [Legionella cincinnatiensis]|uniref:Ribonuclease T2 family n=1 Tax=Legionella cincinnatiensis TaxID=28085 RepID=A0A378IFE7_9GAMM|nr:ribonuclease T [Legionella cincinnatiensis]KTC92077.1 ribonuclease T2 family protein [Legionella cincinnatiensis]STX33620.1 ribonuclease T2 family [Legionella cincinnatiensis]